MWRSTRKTGLSALTLIGLLALAACGGAGESEFLAPDEVAQVSTSSVLPPGSSSYGKSLAEWMNAYWTWFFGASAEGGEKNVVFMPLPAGEWDEESGTYVGELDATLAPGDAFFLPMMVWVGETYDPDLGIEDDDPEWEGVTTDEVFTNATVEIVLDGKTIIDSDEDDMEDFLVYTEFEETIWYGFTTDWGSIGAIWAKGLGFVHTPLSKGEHTLHLYVYSDDWGLGFDNTWYITVEK